MRPAGNPAKSCRPRCRRKTPAEAKPGIWSECRAVLPESGFRVCSEVSMLATMRFICPILVALGVSLPSAAAEPFMVSTSFDRPPYEEVWGTLFEARSENGRFVCSAGFVNAIQTRFHTNTNDLEFWCRDTSKPLNLDWRALPKPHPTLTQAYIANYQGTLVDAVSYQAWAGAKWVPLADVIYDFGSGTSIFWQRFGSGDFIHTKYGNCGDAFSLRAGGSTLGALPDNHPTFVITDGREVVMMDDHGLGSAAFAEQEECVPIEFTPLAEDVGRSYGGIVYDRTIYIGGSSGPDNGRLYSVQEGQLRDELRPPATKGRIAGEYYSYTSLRDELLVGLYPSGSVAALSLDRHLARYTNDFTPHPLKW